MTPTLFRDNALGTKVDVADAANGCSLIALGRYHEWHVDISKSLCGNDMGKKGLACLDGLCNQPIFGKEALRGDVLTMDGLANKRGFSSASFYRTGPCRLAIF